MDEGQLSDGQLLNLFLKGSQSAFEDLMQRHGRLVLNVCNRQLHDLHLAEDATQVVFLALAQKASSLRNRSSISGWLHKVAWYVSTRQKAARLQCEKRDQRVGDNMKIESPQPSQALWNDVSLILDEELNALPNKLQVPFLLHCIEGLSEDEGARRLNCARGTFSSRLSRARELLRERLSRRGIVMPAAALTVMLSKYANVAELSTTVISGTSHVAGLAIAGNLPAVGISGNNRALLEATQNWMFKAKLRAWGSVAAVALLLAIALNSLSPAAIPLAPMTPSLPAGLQPTEKPQTPTTLHSATRMLGSADFQAPGYVRATALNKNGSLVASAGVGHVTIWDTKSKKMVHQLKGNGVYQDVYWLHDGRLIVLNNELRVWDPLQGTENSIVTREKISSQNIWMSSDGDLALFTSDNGRNLAAWEIAKGQMIFEISPVTHTDKNLAYLIKAVALTRDRQRLVCLDTLVGSARSEKAALGSMRVSVWDVTTRKLVTEWLLPRIENPSNLGPTLFWNSTETEVGVGINGKKDSTTFYFNADGTLLKQHEGSAFSAGVGKRIMCVDGRVHVRTLADGSVLNDIDIGEERGLTKLCLSNDGRWLSGPTNNNSFLLVDLNEKNVIAPAEGHLSPPVNLQYTPDGRLIAFDGNKTRLYFEDGTLASRFEGQSYYTYGCTVASSRGRLFLQIGRSDRRPEVWDSARGVLLGHLTTSGGNGRADIVISPDASTAITSGGGQLVIHDLLLNRIKAIFKGTVHPIYRESIDLQTAVWTSNSNRIFLADFIAVKFQANHRKNLHEPIGLSGAYSVITGERLFRFQSKEGTVVESIRQIVLSESRDLVFMQIENSQGAIQFGVWKASDGSFVRYLSPIGNGVRFCKDGTRLIGTDGVASVDTGELLYLFPKANFHSVSPSGTLLAIIEKNGALRILETRSGREIWRTNIGHQGDTGFEVRELCWHPGEMQVAVAAADRCPLFQVSLFKHETPESTVGRTAPLENVLRDLEGIDLAKSEEAFAVLLSHGDSSVTGLQDMCDAQSNEQPRRSVNVLEILARNSPSSKPTAESALENVSTKKSLTGNLATDALHRLQLYRSALKLRATVRDESPLHWPASESAPASQF